MVLVDSSEIPVQVPYWILAEERLRKREKVTKGRGAGEDFAKERPPPLPFPSSRLHEDHQLCRLACSLPLVLVTVSLVSLVTYESSN